MSNIFFTADTHYHHFNILRFCDRNFKDIKAMNDSLITNHNNVVKSEDTVYHLGDFAMLNKEQFNKCENTVRALNGTHILILGNHDYFDPFTYIKMGFQSVHTSLPFTLHEKDDIVLIHDPAAAGVFTDKFFLCGHVHQLFAIHGNAMNVGVDVRNFKPLHLDEIVIEYNNWKSNK